MAAKLKVFVTSDGLTDYVVATTSRPKADRPPTPGSSVAESAQGMLSLWVSVI